jgi:predicted transcriptional regulator YdeE
MIQLEKKPAFLVVGIARRTCNTDERSMEDIPAVWQEFFSINAAGDIRHQTVPPVMYTVYSDYEKDWTGEYSFLVGCGVDRLNDIPAGMEARQIPAQTYAHFVARGEMPQALLEVWTSVWQSDLPRLYTYDFDVYDHRFTRPNKKEVDVFVAVDPLKITQIR